MQSGLSNVPVGHGLPHAPCGMVENSAYSLYEVRTSWGNVGYLIAVARGREQKFLEAMELGQGMMSSKKLFETSDRSFALLVSAWNEF